MPPEREFELPSQKILVSLHAFVYLLWLSLQLLCRPWEAIQRIEEILWWLYLVGLGIQAYLQLLRVRFPPIYSYTENVTRWTEETEPTESSTVRYGGKYGEGLEIEEQSPVIDEQSLQAEQERSLPPLEGFAFYTRTEANMTRYEKYDFLFTVLYSGWSVPGWLGVTWYVVRHQTAFPPFVSYSYVFMALVVLCYAVRNILLVSWWVTSAIRQPLVQTRHSTIHHREHPETTSL